MIYFKNLSLSLNLVNLLMFLMINFVHSNQTLNRQKRLYSYPKKEFLTVDAGFGDDFEMIEEIPCSRNHKRTSNLLHKNSLCSEPRKQLVSLRMPSKYYMPGIHYMPNKYEVERCDGVCHHPNHKCLPIEKEMVDVSVTAISILAHLTLQGGSQRTDDKCMYVKIEKHIRCGCQCAMNDQMCEPGKQVFSSQKCACECLDVSKARTCADHNRMWSNEKCDCVCPTATRRDCSSGAMFDEENCRCVETMS